MFAIYAKSFESTRLFHYPFSPLRRIKNNFVLKYPLNKEEEPRSLFQRNEASNIQFRENLNDKIFKWYRKYQDFFGISEVLEAQKRVTELSDALFAVQTKRRVLHREVEKTHQLLLNTHQQITRSELYSEHHYDLFEKARQMSGSLKKLQDEFASKEDEERTLYTQLSNAIKYCHEKERNRSEHTKYWTVALSIVSATIAAIATSLNNWLRTKKIKDHSTHHHHEIMNQFDSLKSIFSNLGRETEESKSYIQTIPSTIKKEIQKAFQSLPYSNAETKIDKTQTEAEDIDKPNTFSSGLKLTGIGLLLMVAVIICL